MEQEKDIVGRLRKSARDRAKEWDRARANQMIEWEAADEIERLRQKLRTVLLCLKRYELDDEMARAVEGALGESVGRETFFGMETPDKIK